MAPDAQEAYCYLTTTGRTSGRPHTIEIWFGASENTLYLLSGGGDRSDWVANLLRTPAVHLRVGSQEWEATARMVTRPEEEARARRLLAAKYQDWREGRPMSDWASTALPIAVDLPAFPVVPGLG
ncbi:MAG TPA: nitroreductase family deazaflavin-dependent oxidoreductase [Actinomycetota bacterium]|jgi:deazaflavin-dependent oxidoreductase (nitroreductase family)|nr:nitroreductase family deazaflavin-dependent oxidoreductase [Actinomycetota bacterium]